MTDLDDLRSRIPGYADYTNQASRHEVDKQIRAWLGEALSEARDRLEPRGAVAEQLDGLLIRCEFSDQRAIRAADHASFDQPLIDRLHAIDREIVDAAGRIRAASAQDELAAALDAAARLLDERLGALAEARTP